MIRLIALFATLYLLQTPAPLTAQESLQEIVRVDVLDGGRMADGKVQAALKLTLAPGWKTYWRAPGDAGIPPEFDWSGSSNISAAALVWPTPEVFHLDGLRSIGYKHQLVLPVILTPKEPGQPIRLSGRIDFGVCSDVCIPASLSFDSALEPGAKRNPAIAAAMAARPLSANEAGAGKARCALKPTANGMEVTAEIDLPPTGGTEVAVIETGNPKLWASEPVVTRSGNRLRATSELVHVEGKPYALDRSALRLTVLGSSRAVDIRGCESG